MSFFGFTQTDLGKRHEDVAVYTWGEESYDGLGDALQEGGDDLNDETFGAVGTVGKICLVPPSASNLKFSALNLCDQGKTLISLTLPYRMNIAAPPIYP